MPKEGKPSFWLYLDYLGTAKYAASEKQKRRFSGIAQIIN